MFTSAIKAVLSALALTSIAFTTTHAQTTVPGSVSGSFDVSSGVANYSIPIQVAPGRGGMQPELSLDYSSGGGNGILGVGWRWGGLSTIHRCPATHAQDGFADGINFDDDDRYCLSGQRLIPVAGINGAVGTEYRTEIDGYSTITSHGGTANHPAYWVVKTKAGQVMTYGGGDNASLNFSQGIISWSVREINDTTGNNPINYQYLVSQNTQYLERIDYAGGSINFIYDNNRVDASQFFVQGNEGWLNKRLKQVNVYAGSELLGDYSIDYIQSAKTGQSLIRRVTHCEQAGQCLEPITFDWNQQQSHWQSAVEYEPPAPLNHTNGHDEGTRLVDLNGDGHLDMIRYLYRGSSAPLKGAWLNTGNGWQTAPSYYIPPTSFYNSDGNHAEGTELIDLNGDGLQDIIRFMVKSDGNTEKGAWLNTANGWVSAPEFIPPAPLYHSASLHDEGTRLVDLNGDGLVDMVRHLYRGSAGPLKGAWLNTGSGWQVAPAHYIPPTSFYNSDDAHAEGTQLVDINGDGLQDIIRFMMKSNGSAAKGAWLNTPNGWVSAPEFTPPAPLYHSSSLHSEGTRLIDLNGDGLVDMVRYLQRGDSGPIKGAWLNTGNGWQTAPAHYIPPTSFYNSTSGHEEGTELIDVNGDGRQDIVRFMVRGGGDAVKGAWLNTLNGWVSAPEFIPPAPLYHSTSQHSEGTRLIDINGDGIQDVVRFLMKSNGEELKGAWLNKPTATQTNALTTVTDSAGLATHISYQPLTDPSIYTKGSGAQYPIQDIVPPQYVVSQVASANGVAGITTVQYQYEGLKAHLRGRGSLGYAKITEVYPDTAKTLETSFYQTGAPYERHSTVDFKLDGTTPYSTSFPFAGTVAQVIERYNGNTINESTNVYYTSTHSGYANIHQLNMHEVVQHSYELGADSNSSPVTTAVTTHSDIDNYGNVGEIVVSTTGGGDTFTKTTTSFYDNDTTQWHLGRLSQSTVVHSGPYGTQSRRSAFTYDPDTGLLLTESVVSVVLGTALTTTTYTYDEYGQKIASTLSATGETSRTSTTHYDNLGRVLKGCNTYNECQTNTYTPEGWLAATTGPNGITTTSSYDGFGRKIREDRADGTWTTIERHFVASGECDELARFAYSCIVTQTSGTQPAIVQYDALGRDIRKIKQSFDERLTYTDTEYNHLGQVTRVSRDYYLGNEIYWANSYYDALDRVIHMNEPGPHGSTNDIYTTYNGLSTTLRSGPDLLEKTTLTNALGQKIRIDEEESAYIEYTYNADGNLLTTRVAGDDATLITLHYDEYGRKIAMDDPDMGHWEYTYDAFGQLSAQEDAKGQITTMDYDLLGRLVQRTELEGSSHWVYGDNSAAQGSIGKLLQESGNGVTKTYSYDNLGRPTATTTAIAGEGSFTTQTEYDSLGRVKRITYPGSQGFFTENVYNANGFLERVRGLRSQAEPHDYSLLQPLIQEAVTLADDYLVKAQQLRTIGQFYQSRIDNYTTLLAKQTVVFEQGTTAGLATNRAYDYLSAGNNTYYIRVPDTFVPISADVIIPIIQPAEHHYKVIDDGATQIITQVSAAEFEAVLPTLVNNGDKVYKLNDTTMTCACESVGHANYLANLQSHQSLLANTVASATPTGIHTGQFIPVLYNGSVIPVVGRQTQALQPAFLSHLNNTVIELETVRGLINAQANSYASSAEQLTVLAEQTLAAADHNVQFVRTLDHAASAYTDILADSSYITYWRALDVDASGRISAEVYGNGIVSDYAYNQATGQLQSLHSSLLVIDPIRHLEYQYDAYNNVTLRHDLVSDIRERFEYDRLDRLTASHVASDLYISNEFNGTQSLRYDVLGNITHKSDVGDYSYGNGQAAGPHAVVAAGGDSFTYDANGNMLTGSGRTLQWSSFNKPTQMTQNGRLASFSYGPDRARFSKLNHKGDKTLYIGSLYEKLTKGDTGQVDQKHYIYANGALVAEHIISTTQGTQTRYLHKDALGSIDLVTDAYANVVDRRSFDAWGKLRNLPWQSQAGLNDPLYLTQLPFTNKGFTGHENIQEVDLIHMNGRVYDATLARFVSADPHIQAGSLSQSYNRYSYVMNNPLKYTDPSGYFFKKLVREVKKAWDDIRPFVGIIVGAILASYGCVVCGQGFWWEVANGAAIGAITGASSAAANGGNIIRGALTGGLSGAMFGGIGAYDFDDTARIFAHAVAGGTMSVIQGGKFGVGFLSAGFTKWATLNFKGTKLFNYNNQGAGATLGRAVVAALIGGTASRIGGGKFENGATTAAMAQLLNGEPSGRREVAQKGNGIQVTNDFEFTEEHARATLKRFWGEAGRIRGMSSDQLSAWLDGQGSLTQEQMNAAFSLATDMAYAGESAELLGKIYSAGRNPTKILKVLATERVNTGELIENIQENWSDTLGSWNPITRHTTVSAGQLNMVRADSPHNYELFR